MPNNGLNALNCALGDGYSGTFHVCIFHHNFRKEKVRTKSALFRTWHLALASTRCFLHPRTNPGLFCLLDVSPGAPSLRTISGLRNSHCSQPPSPRFHLQTLSWSLPSPVKSPCRRGWAMIFPALNQILAMPDPSAIFICFFSKCQISFSVTKHKNVSLFNPKLPWLTGTKPSHNLWGPQSASLASWHLTMPSARLFHALSRSPSTQWPEPRCPAHGPPVILGGQWSHVGSPL